MSILLTEEEAGVDSIEQTDRALLALAEQLKTPLVHIAQLSELNGDENAATIAMLSRNALRSIDTLMFSQQQVMFELEPVSIGAVLYDVAHELSPLAKQYDVELEIDERGRTMPVMTHAQGLQALLESVGGALVRTPESGGDAVSPRRLVLGSHRTGSGIVVGAFGSRTLSQSSLTDVRNLFGRAAQASPTMALNDGASIVAADLIATRLQSVLKVYRHASVGGLGVLFAPSSQLRLMV